MNMHRPGDGIDDVERVSVWMHLKDYRGVGLMLLFAAVAFGLLVVTP